MLSPEDNKALTEVGGGHGDGPAAAALLAPDRRHRRAGEGADEGGAAAGRGPGAVPGPVGRPRPAGPGVSSPPHQLALRDPGGARPALRVPRVALGRGGTLPRSARGADRQHVHGARAQHGVPRAGSGRAHLRLPRPGPGAGAAPLGLPGPRRSDTADHGAGAQLQLGAGDGELRGPDPHGVPARAPNAVSPGAAGESGSSRARAARRCCGT